MTAKRYERRRRKAHPREGATAAGGRDEGFFDRVVAAYQGAAHPGGDCGEWEGVIELAEGALGPERAAAVRQHLETCADCLGVFLAVAGGDATAMEARRLRPAVRRAAAAADRGGRRLELDYPSWEAFREEVVGLAPDIAFPDPSMLPASPEGAPDWTGGLLVAGRPSACASDAEAGRVGLGKVVQVRRGKVRGISFFDVVVTHRQGDAQRTVVSWYLPESLVPLGPGAQYRCAWVSPEGRLWTPVGEVEGDPDEGRFVARFPADVDPDGELRFLVLEVGG